MPCLADHTNSGPRYRGSPRPVPEYQRTSRGDIAACRRILARSARFIGARWVGCAPSMRSVLPVGFALIASHTNAIAATSRTSKTTTRLGCCARTRAPRLAPRGGITAARAERTEVRLDGCMARPAGARGPSRWLLRACAEAEREMQCSRSSADGLRWPNRDR